MAAVGTLVATYGVWAVLLGTFLEGETVLVLGGFAARRGYLDPWAVALAGLLGAFAGDQVAFVLGRRKGRPYLERHAKPVFLERIQDRIRRHPSLFIVGSRFFYGLRTVAPALVGASGVPHGRFALLDLVGAAFWSALVTLGGYAFGMAFEGLVEHGARYEIVAILLIAALGAAAWTVHFLRKRRRR
jgi:membrane protein DedA with SNARE-associated domain